MHVDSQATPFTVPVAWTLAKFRPYKQVAQAEVADQLTSLL